MPAPDLKPTIKAAGGVLRRDQGRTEYLVVHRPKYDDWSLPKGKLDLGESYLMAAHREVVEETGYQGANPIPVGSIGYETLAGSRKLVRWWSMTSGVGAFRPNAEVDDVRWLPPAEAQRLLSYRNDREVLDRAHRLAADSSAATIHLVAETTGREEAVSLALELCRSPLTRIIGGGPRSDETLAPLAETLDISPEVDARLNEDAAGDDLLEFLRELSGDAVAAASHSKPIETLLHALAGKGVEPSGPREWPMGSVCTLHLRSGEVTSAAYSPSPRTQG